MGQTSGYKAKKNQVVMQHQIDLRSTFVNYWKQTKIQISSLAERIFTHRSR